MTQSTIVRPTAPPQELTDADLEAAGMLDPAAQEFDRPAGAAPQLSVTDLDFDRTIQPGDTLFSWPQGGQRGFEAQAQGTDPTLVVIYRIDGSPVQMRKDWAILRLLKRYPKNHPSYPNQPVFYKRQLRVPAPPTVPCPARDEVSCGTLFYSELQADQHMRGRHQGNWARREEQRTRDLQERTVRASERQAEMIEKFLAMGGNAAQLPVAEPEPDSNPVGAAPVSGVLNPDTATRQELVAYASEHGIAKALGYPTPIGMKGEELREAVRAFITTEATV